jgi:hypothetical protein
MVPVECFTPSLIASSSAIRSSPHPGWPLLMQRIKALCSSGMQGRPGLRERHRQYRWNPRRCQAITVAGFTNASGERHSDHTLETATQQARSTGWSRGRLCPRA